jgi:hypothetical protein
VRRWGVGGGEESGASRAAAVGQSPQGNRRMNSHLTCVEASYQKIYLIVSASTNSSQKLVKKSSQKA